MSNQSHYNTFTSEELYVAVLEGLSALGCPVYGKELAVYLHALLATTRTFPTPARIERLMLSFLNKYEIGRLRAVHPMLCPALTMRGETIIRLITRSDWSLEWRLIAATTGHLRHLRITARLCDLILNERHRFNDLHPLLRLASSLARGLPGTIVKYEQYNLEEWRDLALELINRSSDEDQLMRLDAAARLLSGPNFNQLHGLTEKVLEEVGA